MFESATFHSRGTQNTHAPQWMLATLALNLTVLVALILIPLLHPQSLSNLTLAHFLYTPPAQIAPADPRPVPRTLLHNPTAQAWRNPFLPPTHIPVSISYDPVPAAENPLSALDSVPGGTTTPHFFPPANPTNVRPAAPEHLQVSQGVAAGLLIDRITPTYPALARAMHIEGTVTLAATISKSGTIDDLRVLSGPTALRIAAQEAVARWRYRPYLLNGSPVAVETTINVVFSLASH
jgi:periplasmic protein TonB